MRYGILLTVVLALLSAACDSGAPPMTQAQRDSTALLVLEVEETISRLTEAMNAHDSEGVLEFYRNSEEFLFLGCTDFILGWDAYSRIVGPYYRRKEDVTFQQEVVRTQILSPTVAVVAVRGSSSAAEALFWTEVLVREEDGRWLIAYEHESWPDCSSPSAPHPFTSGGPDMGLESMGETEAAVRSDPRR